jgi:hypothetical protein
LVSRYSKRGGRSLYWHSLQDPFLYQPVEPVGEDVPRDSKALLELVETAEAEEDVADDEERPALANDLERPRDRAVLALVAALQHAVNCSRVSCITKPSLLLY